MRPVKKLLSRFARRAQSILGGTPLTLEKRAGIVRSVDEILTIDIGRQKPPGWPKMVRYVYEHLDGVERQETHRQPARGNHAVHSDGRSSSAASQHLSDSGPGADAFQRSSVR